MSWIGHFLAVAVFGVAVPMRQGLDFLDVMFLLAYACLPCLFAAPLVAESVAGRKTLPPREGYMAQVGIPFLFAVLWNLLIFASAIGFVEMARAGQMINNATFRPLVVFVLIAALYFALCYPLSVWSRHLERRFDVAHR